MEIVNQADVHAIVDNFFTSCNILNTYKQGIVQDKSIQQNARMLFLMHTLPFNSATVEAVDYIFELVDTNPELAKCIYKVIDILKYDSIFTDMDNIQRAILNKCVPRYELQI